jgi:hypothetical protein
MTARSAPRPAERTNHSEEENDNQNQPADNHPLRSHSHRFIFPAIAWASLHVASVTNRLPHANARTYKGSPGGLEWGGWGIQAGASW